MQKGKSGLGGGIDGGPCRSKMTKTLVLIKLLKTMNWNCEPNPGRTAGSGNDSGDKLAGELIKIRPDIPIILSTGYSKKISDKRATEIQIKAFAMKPISKIELAKTVRKVLDEQKV
ncbi:MAG: hypothetical protein PVF36_09885 [Desulfobacterales bacterium]